MKKYKLKSDLFTGFKTGDIIYPFHEEQQYALENAIHGDRCIHKDIIEKLPEYFQEVKEKEYTILSFIGIDGRIRSLNESGNYRAKDFGLSYTLDSMLKGHDTLEDGSQKIHSVRRESDGEIFTLEDNILAISSKDEKIKKFKLENNELWIDHCFGLSKIQSIQKAPIRKPILITRDKIEVYANCQVVHSVRVDNFFTKDLYAADAAGCGSLWLHFGTLDARESYLKKHKPMYSLNDVCEIMLKHSKASIRDTQEVVEELVKLNKR